MSACAGSQTLSLASTLSVAAAVTAAVYKKGKAVSTTTSPKLPQAVSGVALPVPLPGWQQDLVNTDTECPLSKAAGSSLYVGKHAVIAGAGPCGKCTALHYMCCCAGAHLYICADAEHNQLQLPPT